MPEDLPKAVMILIWLLSGTIIVGALLMKTDILVTLLFIGAYFGVPVTVNYYLKNRHVSKS